MARKVTFRATAFKNKAERLTEQLRKLIEGSIQETGEGGGFSEGLPLECLAAPGAYHNWG